MHKIRERPAACAVMALMLSLALTLCVYADDESVLKAEDIDEEEELSLTVCLESENGEAAGVQVSIFRVADVSTKGGAVFYTALAGDYDYEGITASESNEIAAELYEMGLEPDCTAQTDSEGNAVFEDLNKGIYLVAADDFEDEEGGEYSSDPFLVCVPLAAEEDGAYVWTYDVECFPKSASYSPEEDGEDEDEPHTGDRRAAGVCAALAAACAVCIPWQLCMMKKRKKEAPHS